MKRLADEFLNSVSKLLKLWKLDNVKTKNNVLLLNALHLKGINRLNDLCCLSFSDLTNNFRLQLKYTNLLLINIKDTSNKYKNKSGVNFMTKDVIENELKGMKNSTVVLHLFLLIDNCSCNIIFFNTFNI